MACEAAIPRPAGVADQHRAPAAPEHQRGAQPGGAGADDDDVDTLAAPRGVTDAGLAGLEGAVIAWNCAKRGSSLQRLQIGIAAEPRGGQSAGWTAATRSSESRARSASPRSAWRQAM